MLAVLVDALRCLQTGGRTAIQCRSFAEAEAWTADGKREGPFSVEIVC